MPASGNDIIGENMIYRAQKGDTFIEIAQRFDLGAQELKDANPRINPRRIWVGSKILIPKEYILPPKQFRKGIVINTAELRLYYFDPDGKVYTFPVAIGRDGWRTPLGKTYVYRKEESPTWHVPKTIRDDYFEKTGKEHPRRIAPGPDNPLGDYAIYLHMDGYLIHGTNNPASIGNSVSSGCVRMYNQDAAELYKLVNRGTPVNIINYPIKAGWRDGKLYLEAHTAAGDKKGNYQMNRKTAMEVIDETLAGHADNIDKADVTNVVRRQSGIPTPIG